MAEQEDRCNAQHDKKGDKPEPRIGPGQPGSGYQDPGKRARGRRKCQQTAERALLVVRYAVSRPGREGSEQHIERALPCNQQANHDLHAARRGEGHQQPARCQEARDNPRHAGSATIARPTEGDIRKARRDGPGKCRVCQPGQIVGANHS